MSPVFSFKKSFVEELYIYKFKWKIILKIVDLNNKILYQHIFKINFFFHQAKFIQRTGENYIGKFENNRLPANTIIPGLPSLFYGQPCE